LASRGIEFDTIWQIIQKADKKWVLASALMGYLAMIARGLRWSNLLEPMGYFPKKWSNIHAVALSYIVSLVIPRSGELVRCTAINQVEDIPVDKLFGTVILERVIDTSILLLFVAFAFLLNYDVFTNLIDLAKAEPGTGQVVEKSFMAKYWWLIALAAAAVGFLLFRKWILNGPLKDKVLSFLSGMKDGFLSIRTMKKKWEFIFYSITIWGLYYLSMMVMLWALHLQPFSWNEGLFLVVAGGLGTVVPTNNDLGTYHLFIKLGVFTLAMSYGFWPDLSESEIKDLGYSLGWLQWGTQTIMMIVVGLVALGYFALQRRKTKPPAHAE